jgi:hypothetical protein
LAIKCSRISGPKLETHLLTAVIGQLCRVSLVLRDYDFQASCHVGPHRGQVHMHIRWSGRDSLATPDELRHGMALVREVPRFWSTLTTRDEVKWRLSPFGTRVSFQEAAEKVTNS